MSDQPFAPLRGLRNVAGSCFARFAARFSFSDDCAVFFPAFALGVFPDIGTRFPSRSAGGVTHDHSRFHREVKLPGEKEKTACEIASADRVSTTL